MKSPLADNRIASRPPGRPRSAEADRAILDAALALFLERGFDGVSYDLVAERAGVARTTIYRRWSSKAELVAEAIAAWRGEPELKRGAQPDGANVEGMIRALAQLLAGADFRRMVARLIGAAPDHPELLATYWRTYMAPRRTAVKTLMEVARQRGRIRASADLDILLDIIAGAVTWQVLVRPGAPSAEDIEAHLKAVLRELDLAP